MARTSEIPTVKEAWSFPFRLSIFTHPYCASSGRASVMQRLLNYRWRLLQIHFSSFASSAMSTLSASVLSVIKHRAIRAICCSKGSVGITASFTPFTRSNAWETFYMLIQQGGSVILRSPAVLKRSITTFLRNQREILKSPRFIICSLVAVKFISFCGQSIFISLTCSIRSMIPLSSSMVSSTEQGLNTTLTTFLQSTFILVSHFSSKSMVLDTPSNAIFGILLKIWKKLSFSAFMFSRRMFSISSIYTTTGFFGLQLSSFFSSQKLDFGQQPNKCSATASWICHRLFVVFPLNFIISYFPYENTVVRVNVFPAPGAPVTNSSLSLFDPEFFYWKNSSNTLLIFLISQSLQRMCFKNMLPLRSARASV